MLAVGVADSLNHFVGTLMKGKMTEQTQVQQQVAMKDWKKVEVSKSLAQWDHRKREERAQLAKAQSEPKLTYSGPS